MTTSRYLRWFQELTNDDVSLVGGKNASLGEMTRELTEAGIRVPDGFATTADVYWQYVKENGLETKIADLITAYTDGDRSLAETGKEIRDLIKGGEFPGKIQEAICGAYRELSDRYDAGAVDVAVRSSATAEDLPTASFAGQLESYLNVSGEEELLETCRRCFASLFTDRAITYREEKGFEHLDIALSVGVQKMVRSDRSGAGVMFSIDTETGFPDAVVIDAAWGLGESVVQGSVNPDRYMVFAPLLEEDYRPIIEKEIGSKAHKIVYGREGDGTKRVETSRQERTRPVLGDDEILQLARWAKEIEHHYDRPMDIEWAKDGDTGDLFVVQARPETVQSQESGQTLKKYRLTESGDRLLTGLRIGDAIASGEVCVIEHAGDLGNFRDGAILVTEMTQPDWVPVMKRASGIVTDEGGRTCHAAIVSRELGIPAVVGTGNASSLLKDGRDITISCAEGDHGHVYEGCLDYETEEYDLSAIPETDTDVMINIASPEGALNWWSLPTDGIGLARMEFIVENTIGVHPMALVHFDRISDASVRRSILDRTEGYGDLEEYFVDRLAKGIGKIAASQYPEQVIVRTSDFKSNEYASLIGGEEFEVDENNPMIGFRGAFRYGHDRYRDGFKLECRALRRVREEMGFTNVSIMIPFCRSPEEGERVLDILKQQGLSREQPDLDVYVMAEIPSNILEATSFGKRFDGFSIGSNDLTQLVLGVDRDSSELAEAFDERSASVKRIIRKLLESAREMDKPVGICGEAPSNYPEFAGFLVREGITSISLSPDSFLTVKNRIAEVESSASS